MRTVKLIVFLTAVVAAFSAAAFAEDQPQTAHRLDEVFVTATKYETSTKEVPASVTVIKREDLEAQNFPNNDVADALRSVAGITLRRAYAPFPAYLNIRGGTSDGTVVLVNGVPTNWEISQAIPVDNIERVEILRGPASALYGANAIGGVVNIITKEGGEEFEATATGGYGSFNTVRGNGAASGSVGDFHYAAAAYKEKSDGTNIVENHVNESITMIQDCSYEKDGASITGSYDLPTEGKVSLLFNYFHDYYTRGRPNVRGDWDRYLTTLTLDQPFGDRVLFKGYVGYRYDDLIHWYDKGGTNYELRQKRYTDYSEIPLELQVTADVGWGNTATAGFFMNHQDSEQDFKDAEGSAIGTNKYKIRTLAGYLQDVWKPLDDLTFTAGVRFDQWKNYDNTFYNFEDTQPDNRTDENWSPKVGVKYSFNDATSIWANYAMGFIAPTPEQLYDDRTSGGNPRVPNPDLKPEKTHSWELGLERWFIGDMLRTRAVGFYSFTEDKIISWFSPDNIWMNNNIGRTQSYGVELDFLLRMTENWTVNANYTYNPVEIDENEADPAQEGNELPFSPKHKANLGVTYAWPENFTVSAFGRYLSRQQTNDDNLEYTSSGEERFMKSSFVVDLKATKHFLVNWGPIQRIDASFSVDNLFEETYRTFYIYEDPGRVFFGEISIKF